MRPKLAFLQRLALDFLLFFVISAVAQTLEPQFDASTVDPAALLRAAAVPTVVPVTTSRELHTALQRVGAQDVVALLQNDVDLSDDVWSTGRIVIPSGRIAVIRAVLDTLPDVTQSVNAIPDAGGKTLNLSQRNDTFYVQTGGTMEFDGVRITNAASAEAYRQHLGAAAGLLPYGLALYPTLNADAGAQIAHNFSLIEYLDVDCSPALINNLAFRVGIGLGDPQRTGVINATTVYMLGVGALHFPIIDPARSKATVADINFLFNTTVRRCYVDNFYFNAASSVNGDSGIAAWEWVLVAIGGVVALAALLAGAAFAFTRRRRRLKEAQHLPGPGGSKPGVAGAASGPVASPFTRDGPRSGPDGEPLRSMDSDILALVQLRDAWRTRIGQVHGLEFREVVGRGGFATVYKGRWRGTVVAVKLLEHSLSGAVTRQIQREAALSTSVSHPNVVVTYMVCTVGLSDLEKLPHYVEVSGMAAQAPQAPVTPLPLEHPEEKRADLDPGSVAAATGATPSSTAVAAARGDARRVSTMAEPGGVAGSVSPQELHIPHDADSFAAGGAAFEDDAAAPEDVVATLIVMEYCDLGSAHEALSSGAYRLKTGAKAVLVVVRTLMDAAMGLDYLHCAANCVHGDLKPANLLLKSTGHSKRGWVAKLGDLGVARMLDAQQNTVRASSITGTHAYTAPETMQEGRLTRASDCYAFGMLMWEMWTETPPFQDLQLAQLSYRVASLGERPPDDPSMPPAYVALMHSCWVLDPTDRPSFEQVLHELRELMKDLQQASPEAELGDKGFLQLLRSRQR